MKRFFDFIFRRTTKMLRKQIIELEEELSKIKAKLEELENKDIIVDLKDDSEINASPKSVRVNYYIWNDWKAFCEANEEYSKKQLISLALKEFMEKHH